ncbi:MAG TPA: hypothetical protein VFW80_04830 [Gaiellaceae bacterium]|nr:hypothetical protein [Gaiellaceae bacterium]
MTKLEGSWRVEREAGLLPPFGLTKTIGERDGWTRAAGLPVAPFRVVGTTLVYRGWPIRDELAEGPDGSWEGRGLLFGREFCRFRLVRETETTTPAV